jgi:HK97 gp10 family phage protein
MPYYRFRGKGQLTALYSRNDNKAFYYSGTRVLIQSKDFQLNWYGPEVAAAVINGLVDAFNQLSDDALVYMKSIVPVDTGNLRDSCFATIQQDQASGRMYLVIGAGMPYAIYVELGTVNTPSQPYIRPTFDYVMQKLPGIVREEVARRANAK